MELQKQVCSLELAKKLKELGVRQNSLFYWNLAFGGSPREYWEVSRYIPDITSIKNGDAYSAFTVAELGEMLPTERYWTSVCLDTRRWRFSEFDDDGLAEDGKNSFVADTEADARAKMLISILKKPQKTLADVFQVQNRCKKRGIIRVSSKYLFRLGKW